MFGVSSIYTYIAVAVVIAGLSGTVMIFKAKAETAQLRQEVAEKQRDTMLVVNQQILAANLEDAKIRVRVYEDFAEARNEAEEFKQKLAKHDLSALALAKPDTLTRLARAATNRVLRQIEAAAIGSGSSTGRSTEASDVSGAASSGSTKPITSPANSSGD